MNIVEKLIGDMPIPKFYKARQVFPRPIIDDIKGEIRNQISEKYLENLKEKPSIAITIGSRGIANLEIIVKEVVSIIKEHGGQPFIIPAMGSHGGANAQGQKDLLARMKITEENVGAPIKSTMEVVQIGESDNGLPVFIDKYADEADGIVILNRIKPHVGFRGKYESGLMKMISIGLGKQHGASICHELGFGTMAENIPSIAKKVIEKKNIIFALAIIENPYDETCKIVAMKKDEIETIEPILQEESKMNLPQICFDKFDVLIVDEIGKDITGTGLDTNIIGRYHTPYASGGPKINKMIVLDLTEKSHGNGNGIGIVDFTTKRLFDKLNLDETYPNAITTTVAETVKIPMILKNDKVAIQAAIKTCNILDKSKVKIVRIQNTLKLEYIFISENLIEEAKKDSRIEILSEAEYFYFNEDGNLF